MNSKLALMETRFPVSTLNIIKLLVKNLMKAGISFISEPFGDCNGAIGVFQGGRDRNLSKYYFSLKKFYVSFRFQHCLDRAQ